MTCKTHACVCSDTLYSRCRQYSRACFECLARQMHWICAGGFTSKPFRACMSIATATAQHASTEFATAARIEKQNARCSLYTPLFVLCRLTHYVYKHNKHNFHSITMSPETWSTTSLETCPGINHGSIISCFGVGGGSSLL